MSVDYWTMPEAQLQAAWRAVFAEDYSEDTDGTKAERFSFVEDASLQRIGAPDTASTDDTTWLAALQKWAKP